MPTESEQEIDRTSTSMTLLQALRARPDDESAWGRFVERYQPLILSWCARRGLSPNDAADVAQDVMLKMARFIRNFEYDSRRSFRAWLKTVTHNAWHDWAGKEARHGSGADDDETLQSVAARDDLILRLQQEYDAEIMELAVLRVQLRVSESVWQAFELTAFDGLTGIEAAKRLQIDVAKLYVDKSRVTKFLQEEVPKLERDFPES